MTDSDKRSMRIVMLGPPGAGKGTQAAWIAERCQSPHVSTGDIFRGAVRARTPIGLEAKGYMDRGELVPDSVVIGIVAARLEEADTATGFVLDGFPRTVEQAKALEASLAKRHQRLTHVVNLAVPHEEVVKRLSGRRVCRECGTMYHTEFDPPAKPATCNKCNGTLYQRDDDQESTILARLEVYDRQTEPLVQYYRDRGTLAEVNGVGCQGDVARRIATALGGRRE